MKKFDITKLHENFTDESNAVILLDDFLNSIKNLSLEEQNLLMKEVLTLSEEYNKLHEKKIKESEIFLKNRNVATTKKRKVISMKKVSQERKKVYNDTIKIYKEEIEKLINMSLEDFRVYILEFADKEAINFYMLGLIKEMVDYQQFIDAAYFDKDIVSLKEGSFYIDELTEKIEILKTLSIDNVKETNIDNKIRIIFLETSSNRAYFLEDIDGYKEYYPSFAKLFTALETGNPLDTKMFSGSHIKLKGLLETRDVYGKTRIFFDLLDDNTYIIFNAIVKKTDKSLGYKNQLINRYETYLQNKDNILAMLDDEEFLERQGTYLDLVKEKLGIVEEPVLSSKIKRIEG